MDNTPRDPEISTEDLRAALKEINVYVDITEDDLKKIYAIALKYAPERLALKIPVSDVMTKDVVTVNKNVNIDEVARILNERRIKRLPVVDNKNKLIGIISRADIVSFMGKQ